jgi:hypothetical protein
MPKARARRVTALPIFPIPMMPSVFHLPVHPGLAAGKGQHISQDRIGNREGERVQGTADFHSMTGTGFGVDRIDPRPPLGDHFEARRAGLDHPLGITVISTDRPIELARVAQEIGLFHTLTNVGND